MMFYIFIILQNKSNNLDDCNDLCEKSPADLAGLSVVSFIAALLFWGHSCFIYNIKFFDEFQGIL